MKKILFSIFVLIVISIVACQQAVKKAVMEKKVTEAPKTGTTGEPVVDAVGKDLNNISSVEKDLSTYELGDLDSGLSDIQKI